MALEENGYLYQTSGHVDSTNSEESRSHQYHHSTHYKGYQ